jgi:hypothetical protein
MKTPIDETQPLPLFAQHVLFFIFGFSGILIINNEIEGTFTESLLLLFNGLNSGLATYGLAKLIGDIRRGKNLKGVLNEIRLTLKKAFDDKRNSG